MDFHLPLLILLVCIISSFAEDDSGTIKQVVSESNNTESTVRPADCPVTCFRTYPVCGINKVTYWCGAKEAKCDGVEVDHEGFCRLDNGGAGGKVSMAGQALLLIHLLWLIAAGILVVVGLL